ncbi:MAG TPA: hypothetical protein VG937_24445 [Polyangiaceae bacterium]|nr:hypothetical protein [Polyangiaceae bacterium]
MMMKIASALAFLACLAPVGCVVTTHSGASGYASPAVYYYGGAHFYPGSFGGDWCAVDQPHAHDFPPDHPECYSYEAGYYYFTGCQGGEPHAPGRVPAGARVHVDKPQEPHAPTAIPPGAPIAPHVATGQVPPRDTHPAPSTPAPSTPPQPPVSTHPSSPPPARPATLPPPARPTQPPAPTNPSQPTVTRPPAIAPKPPATTPPATPPATPAKPPTPAPQPSEPGKVNDPKRPGDPRDPRDDNATVPNRKPDPRDPKNDNAQQPPAPPLKYPTDKRKDSTRYAPSAPKPKAPGE